MKNTNKKQSRKSIVLEMIRFYCKQNHFFQRIDQTLCDDCKNLYTYSVQRIDSCPHLQSKSFCSSCTTPCYKEDYRKEIKKVMKFSGPRMTFHHPILALKHLIGITIKHPSNLSVKQEKW